MDGDKTTSFLGLDLLISSDIIRRNKAHGALGQNSKWHQSKETHQTSGGDETSPWNFLAWALMKNS
jgi:hypothetical protein